MRAHIIRESNIHLLVDLSQAAVGIMTVSAKDICKEPEGQLPSLIDALKKEEVEDPTKLPLASLDSTPVVAEKRTLLNAILDGKHVEEAGAFFMANDIPISTFAQIIWMIILLIKGERQFGAFI